MKRHFILIADLILVMTISLPSPVRGQSQPAVPAGFSHERTIIPGGSGLNRLGIDLQLLAGADPFRKVSRLPTEEGGESAWIAQDGLDDLRIYDARNREVPYLLAAPAMPPRWAAGQLLPGNATPRESGFDLDLGRPLRVDRIRFGGLPGPFQKRLRLEGSLDAKTWTVILAEGTIFDFPAERLSRLELGFAAGERRFLRVTWDDHASAVLPLPGAVAARVATADSLAPALHIQAPFERNAGAPAAGRYVIRLPAPGLPVTTIELAATGANVLCRVRITEVQPAPGETLPALLGVASLWHRVPSDPDAAELTIPMALPRGAELALIVESPETARLRLTGVRALLSSLPWICFDSPGTEPLTARFGNRNLRAPVYDVNSLRDRAGRQPAAEAHWGDAPGGPAAPPAAPHGRLFPAWLWGLIGVALLATWIGIRTLLAERPRRSR